MPVTKLRTRAAALAGTVLLSACTTVGPDFQRPQVPAWLADWMGGSLESLTADRRVTRGSASCSSGGARLMIPCSKRLVAEAQRVNPNVRTAGLRIMEARAQLGIAGSALYPQVQQATSDLLWAGEQRTSGARDTSAVNFERRVSGRLGARFLGQVQTRHRGCGRQLLRQHCAIR